MRWRRMRKNQEDMKADLKKINVMGDRSRQRGLQKDCGVLLSDCITTMGHSKISFLVNEYITFYDSLYCNKTVFSWCSVLVQTAEAKLLAKLLMYVMFRFLIQKIYLRQFE